MTAPGEALGGGAQVLGVDRLRSPRLAMPVDGDGLHTFRRYPRISTIPPRTVPMRRNSSTLPVASAAGANARNDCSPS